MSTKNYNLKAFFTREEKKVRIFLVIFFIVGVIGFTVPLTRNIFIRLTTVALLLSFFVLALFNETDQFKYSLLFFAFIFVFSFLIEMTGVNTGFPFGNYTYGKGLGIKLLDTPLMIGINWLLLVYCTSIIVNTFTAGATLKILFASLLMVIYDIVLEQTAPLLDMWQFNGGIVPLRNYLSWFIVALIFHLIIKLAGIRFNNRIAAFIFFLHLAFFVAIILILKVL